MSNTHQDWRALAEQPVSYARPNIIICGPSGAGKPTSLRNLDPATTIVINTERKALPFRGAAKFTKQAQPSDLEQFDLAFARAMASDAKLTTPMHWRYCRGLYPSAMDHCAKVRTCWLMTTSASRFQPLILQGS